MNDSYPKAIDNMLDTAKWLRKDVWAVDDAVCLLRNIDPDDKDNLIRKSEQFEKQYIDDLDTVEKAEGMTLPIFDNHTYMGVEDVVYAEVEPKIFIQWANSKGYDIPEPFKPLLEKATADIPSDSLTALRESNYWLALEKNAIRAIEEFPAWEKEQKKIQLTGNLTSWLKESVTDNTREQEIIKNVLSEVYEINK